MKTITQHIEHARSKPHHVRRRIAMGVATAGTALIAVVWLGTSLATGVFALKNTSFADAGAGEATLVADNTSGTQGVAGAAASTPRDDSGPARIQIIDTATSSSMGKAEQTTISF